MILVLEELGLTYHAEHLDFASGQHKAPAHVALNPNGRIPTLVDHTNGDFVVWESNAILLYLVERYDKAGRLSVAGEKERAEVVQWLFRVIGVVGNERYAVGECGEKEASLSLPDGKCMLGESGLVGMKNALGRLEQKLECDWGLR